MSALSIYLRKEGLAGGSHLPRDQVEEVITQSLPTYTVFANRIQLGRSLISGSITRLNIKKKDRAMPEKLKKNPVIFQLLEKAGEKKTQT